jgi:hypothetical protein
MERQKLRCLRFSSWFATTAPLPSQNGIRAKGKAMSDLIERLKQSEGPSREEVYRMALVYVRNNLKSGGDPHFKAGRLERFIANVLEKQAVQATGETG